MDLNNVLNVQHQIRESSEDLQKYLLDLESWEKDMKKKEEELKFIQTTSEEEIPPIRNSLFRPKRKNKHKKQKEKGVSSNKVHNPATDYESWEKFDADAEIKKLDEEKKQSSASETSENEDDFCIQKRQQLALVHKDKGNNFFKNGNYDSAINSYTMGLQLDPENPLLAANRAMAFLKKEQFQAAENDCTHCLSIDPTYVKAYLRRGTARKNLKKYLLAKTDFSKALELEPENKQAQTELKKLSKISTAEDLVNLSENEAAQTQNIWSQFLGNKSPNHTEEYNKEDSRIPANILEINEERFVEEVESRKEKNLQNKMDKQKLSVNSISQWEKRAENVVSKPQLPSVPVNSFQFLSDWNEISLYPDLRYKYVKQFPPEKFPIFFEHDMEPAIFSKLLETLSTSFIENGDDVFDYMKYLALIGRFQTMIMFLSDQEENDLKKLLEYIKTSGRSESETLPVLKKYES